MIVRLVDLDGDIFIAERAIEQANSNISIAFNDDMVIMINRMKNYSS